MSKAVADFKLVGGSKKCYSLVSGPVSQCPILEWHTEPAAGVVSEDRVTANRHFADRSETYLAGLNHAVN